VLREQQSGKAKVRADIDNHSIFWQILTKTLRFVFEPQLAFKLILDFLNVAIGMERQPIATAAGPESSPFYPMQELQPPAIQGEGKANATQQGRRMREPADPAMEKRGAQILAPLLR
jgi:hypothetical protein